LHFQFFTICFVFHFHFKNCIMGRLCPTLSHKKHFIMYVVDFYGNMWMAYNSTWKVKYFVDYWFHPHLQLVFHGICLLQLSNFNSKCLLQLKYSYKWYLFFFNFLLILIMTKRGVLQLALQFNFWVAKDICNSLHLYHECQRTNYMSYRVATHFISNASHCKSIAT